MSTAVWELDAAASAADAGFLRLQLVALRGAAPNDVSISYADAPPSPDAPEAPEAPEAPDAPDAPDASTPPS